jgi:nicotinic acid mononucleotide adenylyltransferase
MWFKNLLDPEEAGWFQESHNTFDKFGEQWAMTPSHKLLDSEGQEDIILLSTGGYAPIHDGHIAMMEAAKIHMESKGFRVRGGYVSPGHDDYVVTHKGVKLFSPERLAYANHKLKDHLWLMVDPWESVGCTCSVNFTAVIDHLEKTIGCRVCYVVGSDNARFSLTFQDRGLLCIVRRTADVLPNPKYRDRRYDNDSEHVFVADNDPIPGSSTSIRRESTFRKALQKKLILRVDTASEPPFVRASVLPEKAEEFSDRIRQSF